MSTLNSTIGFHGITTATIDWCEANYQFSYYIAELANSLSNLITIAVALYGCFLTAHESLPGRFVFGFMGIALVGAGSFWFHATLLFHAQLADELPMIYVTSTALWLLFDHEAGFTFQSARTRLLALVAAVFNVLFTWSYYINRNPVYHQVVFGALVFSVTGRIVYLLTRSDAGKRIPVDKRHAIKKLVGLGAAQFAFAFMLWNLDNIFCDTLTRWKVSLGWPLAFLLEGHSWWHVFTASGTYFKFIGIEYLALCLKDDHRKYAVHYKMGLIPFVKRVDKRTQ